MESVDRYSETLRWLYSQLPMFSRIGAAAYKPGLETTQNLDAHFGFPHRQFKSIHVGGTNGKGSTSHLLASILQSAGYKVGLYTSPHLADFRERIRINGEMIPRQDVVRFVDEWKDADFNGKPSFFELTMMMAFQWYARQKVDYAVIEVGMGGRLDSTNVITPILSVITNISKDHTQFLGETLKDIASEKAGIIKPGIPVIIGETQEVSESVFQDRAREVGAPIQFADKKPELLDVDFSNLGTLKCTSRTYGKFSTPLYGHYQKKNINTALAAINELKRRGIDISESAVVKGMEEVTTLTGLMGRWQITDDSPLTICDTGHNIGGLSENMPHLDRIAKERKNAVKRMVIGFVNDKDVTSIVKLFPKDAKYYFTKASVPRAMAAEKLKEIFEDNGMSGTLYPTVEEAVDAAKCDASPTDIIYIGGSTFIVADYLATLNNQS